MTVDECTKRLHITSSAIVPEEDHVTGRVLVRSHRLINARHSFLLATIFPAAMGAQYSSDAHGTHERDEIRATQGSSTVLRRRVHRP